MAFTISTPCQNSPMVFCSRLNSRVEGVSLTPRWQRRKQRVTTIDKHHMFQPLITRKYVFKHKEYLSMIPMLAAESDSVSAVPSVSDVIKRFYTCINEKDLTQLEGLISSDCFLEDSVFPQSFLGKKEVMSFVGQLVESMGKNVHFRTGIVCEGDELVGSLDWHLEWKQDQIPFSRGCSIFQCAIEDDKLVIAKARIITESPMKPGKLALGVLKILASLFDEFPQAAKWFLKSPHTILAVAMKIYNILFAPIVNPVLAFYITLWRLITRLLGYIICFLHIIAKFFNKNSSKGDPDNSDSITN